MPRRRRRGTYGNQHGSLGSQGNQHAAEAVQQTQDSAVVPYVPDYQSQQAQISANRNVALSNAQAAYDTGAINRDFGYTAQGGIDPNNPYARASLLEQSFKQNQAGTTNSMAAQGQLYAGATQNALNENTRQYSIGKNQLQNQYRDSLQGVKQNQLSAYANAGSAASQADFEALLRALGQK